METLPTVRHLRHLMALAVHAHFGRAADACFITQTTLSASIKELENVLQAALVDRSKRHVVLTPLGLDIVERARRVMVEMETLAQTARAARAPLCGMVRMGAIPTVGPYLLPRVLPELRRIYGALKLYLVEDVTARLVEALQQGKLDVLLLALPYDCGAAETVDLFEDPFVVGLPAAHPLACARQIDPEQLRSADLLLLKDGHCLREHGLAACHMAEQQQVDAFAATSLPTLVQMVDNGLGITLLPELAIGAGLLAGTSVVTRPLRPHGPPRRIGLVWRRGTGRRAEFEILAAELCKRAKPSPKPALTVVASSGDRR
jgi:LysR family hydrogen peroxide-inducible transcriptional activator